MRYGDVTLYYETGSLSITKKKSQLVRHYIGTDESDCFSLGRQSTTLKCNLMARTDEERILIEQLLHESVERELHFDDYYYKKVVTSESFETKPLYEGRWIIPVEFIALDPIPYDETSGTVLY